LNDPPDPHRPQPFPLAAFVRAFGHELTAASERLQRFAEQWSERSQALARAFDVVPTQVLAALVKFQQQFEEIFPENWRGLETEQLHDVLDIAITGKLSVVWAPRRDVLQRLAGVAHHAGRERVLVEERAALLEDVRALLEVPTAGRRTDRQGGPVTGPRGNRRRRLRA
jgi:hypothetical protein